MYAKPLAILLLLSGISYGLIRLYDAGGDAREDRLVREWAEERLKLVAERDNYRQKAEAKIIDEKPVWNERKEKARTVVADCSLPDVHIGVLRESGIFSGGQVRDAVNN